MRVNNILFNNFWPKLISLGLAVATWFYVFDLVSTDAYLQRKETAEEVLARTDMMVKEVPVKTVFSGRSPEGYKVKTDEVIVSPSEISIFGPREILEDVTIIRTDKINLGEYTRSAKLNLGLHSSHKFLKFDDKVVEVYLPVEAISNDK